MGGSLPKRLRDVASKALQQRYPHAPPEIAGAPGGRTVGVPESPILAMPRTPGDWAGAAALWVTVVGWASALGRLGYEPRIMTPNGEITVDECIAATAIASAAAKRRPWPLPRSVRQALRDGQRALKTSRDRSPRPDMEQIYERSSVPVVWQHHELFHRAGEHVARLTDAPLIEYVHAPIGWEGRRWGVRRPGWGSLLERRGEVPQLLAADLVACVSDEVVAEVTRLGVPFDRTTVSPMGVDTARFSPRADGSRWRRDFATLGDFIVGWIGSFRRFHAIDLAIESIGRLRSQGLRAGLVLVGDGQDRQRLEEVARRAGVHDAVRFTGQIANIELPEVLAALDAAVVTADAGQEFHYSPLKLREYLAMGLPVVAPDIGEVTRVLDDGVNGILYAPGDSRALADAIADLASDRDRRVLIGRCGRELAVRRYSWDAIVRPALERVGVPPSDR